MFPDNKQFFVFSRETIKRGETGKKKEKTGKMNEIWVNLCNTVNKKAKRCVWGGNCLHIAGGVKYVWGVFGGLT
jgi:hypothetical protein